MTLKTQTKLNPNFNMVFFRRVGFVVMFCGFSLQFRVWVFSFCFGGLNLSVSGCFVLMSLVPTTKIQTKIKNRNDTVGGVLISGWGVGRKKPKTQNPRHQNPNPTTQSKTETQIKISRNITNHQPPQPPKPTNNAKNKTTKTTKQTPKKTRPKPVVLVFCVWFWFFQHLLWFRL